VGGLKSISLEENRGDRSIMLHCAMPCNAFVVILDIAELYNSK